MDKVKIKMIPELSRFEREESGIKRVIEAWNEYGHNHDMEFVEGEDYDLFCVHAGTTDKYPKDKPVLACCHGLYWSADYQVSPWELRANENVMKSIKRATAVTVPSAWVAETLQRDMRLDPFVVPHGIVASEWDHDFEHGNYVLWNKNRNADVCSPVPVGELAMRMKGMVFATTFAPVGYDVHNITAIGLLPHEAMKVVIQKAQVYMSTTKETFGIGVLEALAAGVPVLGFAYGGNLVMVEHGKTGYLAMPNNYDDLADGLRYCVQNRDRLSYWAKESAKKWTWDNAMEKLREAVDYAMWKWRDGQRPTRIPEELYKVA